MNNYPSIYLDLKKDIDLILSTISSFIKRKENSEFLTEVSKTDKSFDFDIGAERFSIRWLLDIKSKRVCFETYHWKYEANIAGNYLKDYLPRFCIIAQDASVFLTGIVSRIAYKQIDYLNNLITTYFSQLMKFATEVNTVRIDEFVRTANNHNIRDYLG